MAKKATTSSTGKKASAKAKPRSAAPKKTATKSVTARARQKKSGGKQRTPSPNMSAAEAVAGVLESPLVKEVIAAGAAAALAALTQQALSRGAGGSTKSALKLAAKAAATAMGARLATEIEEIVTSGKQSSREEG